MLDERFSDTSDRLSRLKVYDTGEEDADEKKCDSDTSEGKAGDTTEETREDILAFGGEGKGCDDSDEEMILCSTGKAKRCPVRTFLFVIEMSSKSTWNLRRRVGRG